MDTPTYTPHTSSILPFPPSAPTPALVDRASLPHDLAALRRPVAVTRQGAPAMRAADGLAHDAGNLLTSLELFTTMLAEPGVLAIEHREMAGELALLTRTLGGLLQQLAPVPAPVAEAGPVVRREPLRPHRAAATSAEPLLAAGEDAGSIVKQCERLLRSIAGPEVALQIAVERNLPKIALGREELTRVLTNLVRNAKDAMPLGGRISVQVRKAFGSKASVTISVEDTGSGIPAHALGQIFQPGFTSKKVSGSWLGSGHHGLGLTIVRNLVEDAGGTIRVSSELKRGTRFELKVPCLQG